MNCDVFRIFHSVVQYCETFNDLIPLSFVLGFYVSIVMQRWWNQYVSIPWPDTIAVFVSSNIHGQDERGRVMRRTIMRYVCLCLSMVFTMNSPRVKKRFPTIEHFVEAGLLTDNEKCIMSDLNSKFPRHSKHWLPIVWAASIVTRARKEGRIRDDFAVKTIIDELNKFRGQCGLLLSYDNISVPLVYTQVRLPPFLPRLLLRARLESRAGRLTPQWASDGCSLDSAISSSTFALLQLHPHLISPRPYFGLAVAAGSCSQPLPCAWCVALQVVTLAVYSYFITCVMGRQFLEITDKTDLLYKHNNTIDKYFPVFTTLQLCRVFCLYWLSPCVGVAVAERLSSSPLTKANWVQSPAGSLPDFRMWESYHMLLVCGFSRESPVSSTFSSRRCSILTSIILIHSKDLAVKIRPNLFIHSLHVCVPYISLLA
ncbi:hypothetical protein PR048_024420 [Dryococelus australis]|uniref:Bestrophin homolog n=1 Tax=Dryococelus australis TaxID=614101 RepID=A0ABQ9GNI5_9NEOP|nr:hypothetical protein PR048_024420 [Dryococelus australis]